MKQFYLLILTALIVQQSLFAQEGWFWQNPLPIINYNHSGLLTGKMKTGFLKYILSENLSDPVNNINPKVNKSLFNNTELLVNITLLGWSDSVWVNKWFDTLSYNAQNNLSEKIHLAWTDSVWENYWNYMFTYDIKNNLKEELVQRWINSEWNNNWLFIYTYGPNNYLSEKLAQHWNSGNSNWHDFSRELYQYDVNNNLIEELHQNWDSYNSTWEDTERWTNTYDSSFNLTESLLEYWEDSIWVNYWKYLFTYDTNNDLSESVRQDWHDSVWVNFFRSTYTYDENNLLIEGNLYVWIDDDWQIILRTIFTYNENHNLINEFSELWDGSNWVNYTKKNLEYITITVIDHFPGKIDFYHLTQNYPNPFNPNTTIRYSVPQASDVVIKVYDVLGNEIETLVSEEKPVGTYEITWYAENLSSGIYFYRLQAGDFIETKKMILMK